MIKCFYKQLTDLDVPKDNCDEARQLIRTIVYAKSESKYESSRNVLMQPIMPLSSILSTGTLAGRSGSHSCVMKMFILLIRLLIILNIIITNKDVTARSISISEMFENVL